ncbi:MAG: hypothetical protein RR541_03345 [Carnobacterium sp.]
MVVLVFTIEIQQASPNRGNMKFADAVMELLGFIVFFLLYSLYLYSLYIVASIIYGLVWLVKRSINKTDIKQSSKRFRSKNKKY